MTKHGMARAALCAALLILLTGCARLSEPQTEAATADPSVAEPTAAEGGEQASKNPIVEITIEGGGVIRLRLDPAQAPITVENFLTLADDGFYDGLTFHRISKDFVIQGGDPDGNGTGGPGYGIFGEFASNGWNNTLSHERGVVSMARSRHPDSAGSQFFIVLGNAGSLDGDFAAFGKVIEGMDVVDEIASVATQGEAPLEPVVMKTVRIVE